MTTFRGSSAVRTGVLPVLALVALILAPHSLNARSTAETYKTRTLAGSYLAGRFARTSNDTGAAVTFYRRALVKDPDNWIILEQSFQMEALEGNWKHAVRLARRLILKRPNHQLAQTLLGLNSFKRKKYAAAARHFKAADAGPIGEVTSTIARAWSSLAADEPTKALNLVRHRSQAEWAQRFYQFHRALIADQAGSTEVAQREFAKLFQKDRSTLRTTLAYARHTARQGKLKAALGILKEHNRGRLSTPHPLVADLSAHLKKRKRLSLLVQTPDEGAAELFYNLGEFLTSQGGLNIGIIYLQMALYIEPQHPSALIGLANAYETSKRYEDAISAYNRIPRSNPQRSNIDIANAFNLNSLDRVDDAKKVLDDLATARPADIRPLDALGSIMRARKRYKEAIEYYTRVLALVGEPEKRHWAYFYARGTSYERLKQWPKAEADLKRALELSADEPMTLNYLGYSWIDQNIHLREGMKLIEKAVALKPKDGYIVDSLGWAHYKLGNFKEATIHLERAVGLRPEDPVLNDHLGDALWRSGRQREARFQWDQALTLSPEPEEAEKIRNKLKSGLPPKKQAKANADPARSGTATGPTGTKKSANNGDGSAPERPNTQ